MSRTQFECWLNNAPEGEDDRTTIGARFAAGAAWQFGVEHANFLMGGGGAEDQEIAVAVLSPEAGAEKRVFNVSLAFSITVKAVETDGEWPRPSADGP